MFHIRSAALTLKIYSGQKTIPYFLQLHALAATRSSREVWWLYGARSRSEHPFAKESREFVQALARGRSYMSTARPDAEDQLDRGYDSAGHLGTPLLDRLGVERTADFYLCGPASFLRSFTTGLKAWGSESTRIFTEIFGPEESITPGIAPSSSRGARSRGRSRGRPSNFVHAKRSNDTVGFAIPKLAGPC
jgi:ferredoxin-NADP reductase